MFTRRPPAIVWILSPPKEADDPELWGAENQDCRIEACRFLQYPQMTEFRIRQWRPLALFAISGVPFTGKANSFERQLATW
jgi:hypothetical protein